MRLLIVCVLLFLALITVDACCKKKSVGKCCGEGGCNIFCCNCDGGCDRGCETDWDSYVSLGGTVGGLALGAAALGRKKREAVDEQLMNAVSLFAEIDVDGNGAISEEEARSHLSLDSARVKKNVEKSAWFAEIDANGDGFIQPREFDRRLA